MKRAGNGSVASAVRNALKQEKMRFDIDENKKFADIRQENDRIESTHSFPRTLAKKTFFTPHLSKGTQSLLTDHIIRSYAVLFDMHGEPTVSMTPYDPTRNSATTQSRPLPAGQSEKASQKIHELEKAGFRFYGTNKDILVFERLSDPKQSGRHWAKRSAFLITTSVTMLTIVLFVFEHFV